MLASIFSVGYNIKIQNTNVILCKFYIYVSFVFSTVPPTVLILASIDRLLISSQNVDTRLYSSKRLAYFSISISTIFWIIFNIHILIKAGIQLVDFPAVVCWYDLSKSYEDFVFYSLFVIHISFAMITIILLILSFKNVRHIRIIPRQQRKQIRSMTKKDFQLLRCLFIQGIILIIFSLLINGFFVYQVATKDQNQTQTDLVISSFIYDFLSVLYNTPYCSCFFVFVSVSKAFRHELKRLAYNICGKDLIVPREQENIAVVNSHISCN